MGMFIVNIPYFRNNEINDIIKANQINKFHRLMDDIFVNQLYLKSHKLTDSHINTFLYMLSKIINSRYNEYYEILDRDFSNRIKILDNTLNSFIENISMEVDENKLASFKLSVSIALLDHLSGYNEIINQLVISCSSYNLEKLIDLRLKHNNIVQK